MEKQQESIIGYDLNGEEVELTPDDLVSTDSDEDIDWEWEAVHGSHLPFTDGEQEDLSDGAQGEGS
ncbi:hypothetical protein HF673_14630 [Acidithiobacillus thiooxidans]|uniref:Uncharacterized protein n=3 Tax=Acidithiobacillus TaxID=119977 RepID=A0A1C2J218_ACITH|nr:MULTISPECIES: hypothetical protein [Acidithiobacillus]MBU2761079.1 hypothetical protein [Acidithiobacillus sulfurivorans]MBU2836964.1 hypothetical protein [Acidithiobacillus thiooxidans]OCX68186.1 hypothetical protein A6M23_18815 [Acidithiobacillus thiooxidans]OCX82303.1 hypothetical protein A6P08_12295 [Acidithiobacillus thiooxidans]QFX96724.1 hypothetical protein GCD22_02539 [Acidithiobacillus thiooxidans ATCC 19377]